MKKELFAFFSFSIVARAFPLLLLPFITKLGDDYDIAEFMLFLSASTFFSMFFLFGTQFEFTRVFFQKPEKLKLETIANKKTPLEVSAAKPFRGDETLYNPEDLLLSALASCHMMSYLYVCAQHNIEVLNYEDNAEAVLEVEGSGSGRFKKVTLNPVVTIKDASKKEFANALHTKANGLCFIANSCNFLVVHDAEIVINAR